MLDELFDLLSVRLRGSLDLEADSTFRGNLENNLYSEINFDVSCKKSCRLFRLARDSRDAFDMRGKC